MFRNFGRKVGLVSAQFLREGSERFFGSLAFENGEGGEIAERGGSDLGQAVWQRTLRRGVSESSSRGRGDQEFGENSSKREGSCFVNVWGKRWENAKNGKLKRISLFDLQLAKELDVQNLWRIGMRSTAAGSIRPMGGYLIPACAQGIRATSERRAFIRN